MQKMYTKKSIRCTKCTQKNPSCTEVDKTYRMYIEVMYNVQNVHTGRPVVRLINRKKTTRCKIDICIFFSDNFFACLQTP